MLIAQNTVKYDGKLHKPGDEVKPKSAKDKKALLDSGAVKEGVDKKAVEAAKRLQARITDAEQAVADKKLAVEVAQENVDTAPDDDDKAKAKAQDELAKAEGELAEAEKTLAILQGE